MKLLKCVALAYNILAHSKLRSWLSIIGIVIGVASVIAILSLGAGMQAAMEQRLGSLGADIVTVSAGFSRAAGAQAGFRNNFEDNQHNDKGVSVKNLTNKELQALVLVPNVAYIQGLVSTRQDMGYLQETTSVSVQGVDTKVWKDMVSTKLDSGRYLAQGDTNVIVLSYKLANGRFKQTIPLNKQVTIDGKPFRVVGILQDSTGIGGGSGSTVYMPIDMARTLEGVDQKKFDSIQIKVHDINTITATLADIQSRLMLVRAVNAQTQDFSVDSVQALQQTIQATLSTVTLFLGAIAAVSLLVGAVGIANSMFTTVLEKTRDIGVMKSIGAKNGDIMLIFLINSAMVGLAGGLIGSIIGIGASQLLSTVMSGIGGGGIGSFSTIVTPNILILVFSISVMIGIVSGIIPAYRASKMNPVDALRYE